MKVLDKPLSVDEMKGQMEQNGIVSGVVEMELSDVIDRDFEDFLDFIAERLVGSVLLMQIDYEVIGHLGNTLYIKASGDASEVIFENEENNESD